MLKIPTLPNEILDSILSLLQVDGDFSTLRSVAQANQNMYDLAIPKIYETVVFNEKNQSKIMYGHGKSSKSSSRGGKPYNSRLMSDILTDRPAYSQRPSGRLYTQAGIQGGAQIPDLEILSTGQRSGHRFSMPLCCPIPPPFLWRQKNAAGSVDMRSAEVLESGHLI